MKWKKVEASWAFLNRSWDNDVTDIHPQAIGFEAEMPAGRARMAYWPADEDGFHWVVESKTKQAWNRFTQHHYKSVLG
ncbi:MAG: hypothetical protein P8Z00_22645 [Anaerolineales bacterium]|jgi:hypothetical protein